MAATSEYIRMHTLFDNLLERAFPDLNHIVAVISLTPAVRVSHKVTRERASSEAPSMYIFAPLFYSLSHV